MDVLFAVLPFAGLGRPAIGVSLLAAEIEERGFSSSVCYFNFDLAEAIGLETYQGIANSYPPNSLIGEWFFADMLFGDALPDEQTYLSRILGQYPPRENLIEEVLNARQQRHAFVEHCVRAIREANPRIVGFTTTFHQTCACLVVAQQLKQHPDPPIIVFGGANCEGEMGVQLARSFDFIDYVCTQEGDLIFPSLLENLLRKGISVPVPGIVTQDYDTLPESPLLVQDLNALPIPDYTAYFERLHQSPLLRELPNELVIETSRGCWWGMKNHCTFCGLNGTTMAFRSKSPERVFRELQTLFETYGLHKIESVDNILDMRFVRTLFPRLAASDLNLELFYEVKANLKYEQLVTMRAGGLTAIQPGIESFSTEVLELMDKGCKGYQNIQLLRWCEELGIVVAWNILYGFPGESSAEYEAMADLLPLLVHVQPPASCSPFRLDRFSPFYMRSEVLGVEDIRPTAAYYYVFPFGRRDLARLAYYFDFDFIDGRDPREYTRQLSYETARWWTHRTNDPDNPPRLDAEQTDDAVVITDTRPCAVQPTHRLEGLPAALYVLCDTAHTLATLSRMLSDYAEEAIAKALEDLMDRKLLIKSDNRYLSLAIFRNRSSRTTGEVHASLSLETASIA